MASRVFTLARQSRQAALLLLGGATAAGAVYQTSTSDATSSLPRLPNFFIPTAYADAASPSQSSAACAKKGPGAKATVALSGFELVNDGKSFVQTVLAKTLKHQKGSSLQKLQEGVTPQFGEQAPPVDPASFFAFLEKQPLSEKVAILDDVVDAVVREAERSAEVEGLTVGMLGGGVACYALAGWWADLALPGAGTIGCSIAAGVSGHNRAKKAALRTRTRFLNAVLDARESVAPNVFIEYLSAPSVDAKSRIASEARAEAFFSDFYNAVRPILKQASTPGADIMETAA